MKKDSHPDYHNITIVMTNGTSYQTRSTWGKEGDELRLDVDPSGHPAWNGGANVMMKSDQLDRFNKRFASFGLK